MQAYHVLRQEMQIDWRRNGLFNRIKEYGLFDIHKLLASQDDQRTQ